MAVLSCRPSASLALSLAAAWCLARRLGSKLILFRAVIVPVDFMAGKERAEIIAGLTEAKLVIQSRFKPERLTGVRSLIMEELEDNVADVEQLSNVSSNAPDDISQVIYTSGTTGNPKGVVTHHRGAERRSGLVMNHQL